MLQGNELTYSENMIFVDNIPVILYQSVHKDGMHYIHYSVCDIENDSTKYMFTCYQDEAKCDLYYNHMITHPEDLCLTKSWATWFDGLKFKEFSTLEQINRNYEALKLQRF